MQTPTLPPGAVPVLDRGWVRLVASLGDDAAIARAARVSRAGVGEDRAYAGLLDYLARNRHTSPFEMVTLQFHARLPIFVARQWVRHRTASLNEVSARYTELPTEFFRPATWRAQGGAGASRQVADGELPPAAASAATAFLDEAYRAAEIAYTGLLDLGVGRELARIVLPVATYTEWYWQANLHNLFHFFELRLHPHAQLELRAYAATMLELTRPVAPIAVAALERHRLAGVYAGPAAG